jgi:ADP-ribose pyrophosphatase
MAEWDVVESVIEYENNWYSGGYDLVEQPDGSTKRYYWASLPPAVVVVARTDDEIVFVEQYRPAIRQPQLELPAGIVDEHDGTVLESVEAAAYETAAARELREETGFDPGSVEFVQECAVATGLLRHRRGFVIATDPTAHAPDRDPNEFLEVHTVPIGEALDRARTPPTNDATLEGILLAKEAGLLH